MVPFVTERRKQTNRYLDRLKIISGNIVDQDVDAIVSALPQSLEYRGNLNIAIEQKAGRDLGGFVKDNIISPRIGDVYLVPGFDLSCEHILFVIMPSWRTEFDRDDRVLLNACRNAMEKARDAGFETLAFPPLASGNNGFPKQRAARRILQGIEDRLDIVFENDGFKEVRIIARTEETCRIFRDRIVQMGGAW